MRFKSTASPAGRVDEIAAHDLGVLETVRVAFQFVAALPLAARVVGPLSRDADPNHPGR